MAGTFLLGLLIVSKLHVIWHMFHEDSISYQKWRIPVPSQFYVRYEAGNPTMWHTGFGVPYWEAPVATISLFHSSSVGGFVFDEHYERFVRGASQGARMRGFRSPSEVRLVVDGRSGYCLQFVADSTDSAEISVSCMIENSPVLIVFTGDSRFAADFHEMVRLMSIVTPAP